MALRISLKPGERLLVDGTWLSNAGGRAATLAFASDAKVLHGRSTLQEADATTPASRLAFVAQLAYVDPGNIAAYRDLFLQHIEGLAQAIQTSDGRDLLLRCSEAAARGDWWVAFARARDLRAYEARVLHENARAK
ncbi:flagellar biosynthesis repressor FlbT [Sandaracinobacteroides saxicola]|uniref:Flagellar protein FlbT n=1 Tax=Sandaracinobacteroides saxicola TaxID=2759707 RepID=A0A7G5IFW7_9SPHN|nr:flagellar biosynthesis repressor FlbT [Sandaracinobacteroides saxicola]QMW22259.1 hypothetical protein H3309_12965 [Sandaracinobacteroides saxicola]